MAFECELTGEHVVGKMNGKKVQMVEWTKQNSEEKHQETDILIRMWKNQGMLIS